ncbi:hypothetical protein ES703_72788 [subsurface metagenome]
MFCFFIAVKTISDLCSRGKFFFGISIKPVVKLHHCLLPFCYELNNIVRCHFIDCFAQSLLQHVFRPGPLIRSIIAVHRSESFRHLLQCADSAVFNITEHFLHGLFRSKQAGQVHPFARSCIGFRRQRRSNFVHIFELLVFQLLNQTVAQKFIYTYLIKLDALVQR